MGDTLAVLNGGRLVDTTSTIKRLTISHKQKPLFALSKMMVQTMLISFNWRSTTNVRMTHNYLHLCQDVPLATETNDLLVVLTAGGSLGATVVMKRFDEVSGRYSIVVVKGPTIGQRSATTH